MADSTTMRCRADKAEPLGQQHRSRIGQNTKQARQASSSLSEQCFLLCSGRNMPTDAELHAGEYVCRWIPGGRVNASRMSFSHADRCIIPCDHWHLYCAQMLKRLLRSGYGTNSDTQHLPEGCCLAGSENVPDAQGRMELCMDVCSKRGRGGSAEANAGNGT